MRVGKVKSYNNIKGYGFIEVENIRHQLFFLYKGALSEGDLVKFEIKASVKGGIYADNVELAND